MNDPKNFTKVVRVSFSSNYSYQFHHKEYSYLISDEDAEKVKDGGYCIVKSPHDGYVVVTVRGVEDRAPLSAAVKSIVCVVDHLTELARKEAREEQRKVLLKKAEARAKEIQKRRSMEDLAESDPELKGLLDEIRALDA